MDPQPPVLTIGEWTPVPPPVLTIGDLAKASNVSHWTIRRWWDDGKLNVQRPIRIGRYRCFLSEELPALLVRVAELLVKPK